MACKTDHPLPQLLDNGMSVQRDDSSTQQHVDDNDGIVKLHVVGKGGGRMSILTLDPTQSVESKLIFDRVQQLSASGNNEIDLQSLLKAAATQEQLKATVHRQKKTIAKLIFGFVATAIVLFALTLGSSLLSGNLIKELYLNPSSDGAHEEPNSASGARLLQDASGNVIASGIAQKVFALTDLPSMSDADLLGMTRVTMHIGGAIRHYKVDAVAKRCGVVHIQSQKVSLFVDDSDVSILGVDGERETLTHNPTMHRMLSDDDVCCKIFCVVGSCEMLRISCQSGDKIGKHPLCKRRVRAWAGMEVVAQTWHRGSVGLQRRLEYDRLGSRADVETTTKGSNVALLDASARQLLASPVSPPALQLQCDDTLEHVLDHTCVLDMNYSVQCPHACDCKSAEENIYGCNPYTADSRICCAALLHGVQHPAPFLIHTAGAQDDFKACTFSDSAANRRGLWDVNEVLTQSAGHYPRSFKVLGDNVVVNISAFRKDDLGCSVDEVANDVKMIASIVENMSRAVTALQVEVVELTKRHSAASGVAR